MKRKIIMTLLIAGLSLFTLGCSKVEPFKTSPENNIKISSMDDLVKNENSLTKSYSLVYTQVQTGKISDDLQKELDKMKEEYGSDYDSKHDELLSKTQELFVVNDMNERRSGIFDKAAMNVIKYYIEASRTDKYKDQIADINKLLSSDFQKEDPINKVKDYMNKNKIVVTDVVFPETFEKKNTMMSPMKYTYSYVIKGTIDGKPFEKEEIQDFYFGISIKDFSNVSKDLEMPLMYVKDHESK